MAFEEALQHLRALVSGSVAETSDRNEAMTRLQLIDRLFFDVLGWSRDEDVKVEEPHGRSYADYVFLAPRRAMIVEAKREGRSFTLPAGETELYQPLVTIMRGNEPVSDAIKQVASYCQQRGVPIGVVANGHQLIAFLGARADGQSPLHGRALVLASLEQMESSFRQLWDTLSKKGIEEKRLSHILTSSAPTTVPPKLSAQITHYPGTKGRNSFQTELQIVSELVLEDVTRSRDLEGQFLEECYCPSGALSQYALVSKSILSTRYAALFDDGAPGPATTPAVTKEGIDPGIVADSLSRRPILLLGDVGSGKTMFLRHLIKVEAASLFEDAVTLYIDLGVQSNLADDLKTFVLDEIGEQLRNDYGVDVHERQFVRGVYNLDLERFRKGIYSDIRETDPEAFALKEIEFLSQLIGRRGEHLRRAIEHLSKARRNQIIIFIDNADQQDDQTQEAAFLIAQEMANGWPATVFVALRPETFHRSIKRGALSGYHPKAFTISPPRVDRVVNKRLEFALKITSGAVPVRTAAGGEVGVSLNQLDTVVRVLHHSLGNFPPLVELIDNLSGGNVRQALDLVKNFLGSGHVDTEKIVDKYTRFGKYTVGLHEFLRATIYGDGVHYDPRSRSPIANLWDVSHPDPYEHFLLPLLIAVVGNWTGTGARDGFVEMDRVYERLQGFGFTPDQIDAAVLRAHRHKLLETSARRNPEDVSDTPDSVRATTIGMYHVLRLPRTFGYLDAMVVDTPILEEGVRAQVVDVHSLRDRLDRASTFRDYLDASWSWGDGVVPAFDWPSQSTLLLQDIERVKDILGRMEEAAGQDVG